MIKTLEDEVTDQKREAVPQVRLAEFLTTHKVKVAAIYQNLLGPTTGQTPAEIAGEIDDFLQLRKSWRAEERNLC